MSLSLSLCLPPTTTTTADSLQHHARLDDPHGHLARPRPAPEGPRTRRSCLLSPALLLQLWLLTITLSQLAKWGDSASSTWLETARHRLFEAPGHAGADDPAVQGYLERDEWGASAAVVVLCRPDRRIPLTAALPRPPVLRRSLCLGRPGRP